MNKKQYGVPDHLFSQRGRGEIKGLSGKTTLEYIIQDTKVLIIDKDDPALGFKAWVENDVLRFNIFTKGYQGQSKVRHPDLFATILAKRAYRLFQENNIAMDRLEANWTEGEGEDNLKKYYATLQSLYSQYEQGLITKDEMRKQAAKNTWTGRLAAKLGFTEITSIQRKYQGDRVVEQIVFTKPQSL